MTSLKLNLGSKTEIVDKLEPPKPPPHILPPKQRQVCYWDIRPMNDGGIVARSNFGDMFQGTIEDFNKYLRS